MFGTQKNSSLLIKLSKFFYFFTMVVDNDKIAEALGYKQKRVTVISPPRKRKIIDVSNNPFQNTDNITDNTINTFNQAYKNPQYEEQIISQRPVQPDFDEQLIGSFRQKFITPNQIQNSQSSTGDPLYDAFLQAKAKQQGQPQTDNIQQQQPPNALSGVPPLLLLGIICFAVSFFIPAKYSIVNTIGVALIVIALFNKIIPEKKKEEIKIKLKNLFKKKNE